MKPINLDFSLENKLNRTFAYITPLEIDFRIRNNLQTCIESELYFKLEARIFHKMYFTIRKDLRELNETN